MATQRKLFNTPWFWVAFPLFSLACMLFAYHFFPKAFPILSIDLTMNRTTALAEAKKKAELLQLGPVAYAQTASFELDDETKNFIELEGGGKDGLTTILQEKIYYPYTWDIRHFEEYNPHELRIYFTPEGTPYGFCETISEDLAGPALSQEKAHDIAINHAKNDWNIDFSLYTLAETSREEKPNKRVDYTFVYERTDKKIEQAPYRLKLMVQGERLTELKQFVQVPEAFKRRYEHMRSANNTISTVSLLCIILIYLLICCMGGFMYLYRRHLLIWKAPIIAAALLALGDLLNQMNNITLAWSDYKTATSVHSFLTQKILAIIIHSGIWFVLYALIIAVAEGLTRKAFGHQPQVWKLWNLKNVASFEVIGRTIGGYFLVNIDVAYVVIMYGFATRYLGWWTPTDTLINPNIVATYIPWFSALIQSLIAGCMEECFFRALPLATAYLVGKKFGRPRLFLILAFIAQAVVFGAAHATYATQPAYARVLELLIPSWIFGGLYLAFGLLPAMISHFVYDVVWFGLPLFITTAPGSLFNQCMVIFGAAIPLLVIFVALIRKQRITTLAQSAYNDAWQPSSEKQSVHYKAPVSYSIVPEKYQRFLIFTGIMGIILWAGTTRFTHDGISLPSRTEALKMGKELFALENAAAEQAWLPLAGVKGELDEQNLFIWRTQGKHTYATLLDSYIMPKHWNVRYATFEGDIIERAEEYQWDLGKNATIFKAQHILPEERGGKNSSQEQASQIAYQALTDYFGLHKEQVQEISAVSSKKPHRTDWTFTYNVTDIKLEHEGQARATVTIADDEVIDIYRHIFVPEQWQRTYTDQKTMQSIIALIGTIVSILLLLFVFSFLMRSYGIFYIHYPTLFTVASFLFIKSSLQLYNMWPMVIAHLSTSQPYINQVGMLSISLLIGIVFSTLTYSYLISMIHGISMHTVIGSPLYKQIIRGISGGMVAAGVYALCLYMGPALQPLWPDYSALGARSAWLSFVAIQATNYIMMAAQALIIYLGIDYITHGWKRLRLVVGAIFIIMGIAASAIQVAPLAWICIAGAIKGLLDILLYVYNFRFGRIRIIWAMAVLAICTVVQQAFFNAWEGVVLGSCCAIVLIVLIASVWTYSLHTSHQHTELS